MTITDHRTDDAAATAKVDIWRCEDCHCFHVRAGEVLLTFTSEEFKTFLRAAGRCFLGQPCVHFTSKEMNEVANESGGSDDDYPLTFTSALEH